MTEQITECKQVTDEKSLKATTVPKWLLCPEKDSNVIYPHRENIEITPLINGKEAFGALEDAIKNAKDTIDIICWGFDPSLRLSGPKGELRYGELLEQKAKDGVQVRVMIWYSITADWVPGFSEESLPDYDRRSGAGYRKEYIERHNYSYLNESQFKVLQEAQKEYQTANDNWRNSKTELIAPPFFKGSEYYADPEKWKLGKLKKLMEEKKNRFEDLYNQAYTRMNGTPFLQQDDRFFNEDWYLRAKTGKIRNLRFTTRDIKDSKAIKKMTRGSEMAFASKGQEWLAENYATHHQKMVLIDYQVKNMAVGFVMGHNMQKNYYDDDTHQFNSDTRYSGFRPWQDISTRVRGTVLLDLNENFSKSWDLNFDDASLLSDRSRITSENLKLENSLLTFSGSVYTCPTAQICRTEYSDMDKSILQAYKRALGNTTDFVYSENQYFRYTPFANQLKEHAQTRKNKTGQDLYWFVVTNRPNSDGEGTNTYAMLQALGQGERLPELIKDERQHLIELEERRERYKKLIDNHSNGSDYYDYQIRMYVEKVRAEDLPALEKELAELKAKHPGTVEDLKEKNRREIKDEMDVDDPKQAFELQNTDGLKVHIATLTSCTNSFSDPNLYTNIYVHSKLLVVDDHYFLLGSANINKRSMEIDTELAIATPTPALASHCRHRLWQMHTKKVKVDSERNYEHWDELMKDNWRAMHLGKSLMGTLTHFYDPDREVAPAND